MVIKDFVLKDVGSGAYTEYEFGGEMVDLYTERPELMTMPMGHLHTHHKMGVFFSGTDMQCLHDNSTAHDMFLSVIVNTQGNVIAKLVFIAKVEQKVMLKLVKKMLSIDVEDEEYLAIFDCKVELEEDSSIIEEFSKVKKEADERKKKYSYAPVKKQPKALPQYQGSDSETYQLFTQEYEKGEQISDAALENVLVRALTIDEIEAASLKDVIPRVREGMPDGDQSDYVEMIIDHYEYILRDEYLVEQFEPAIERSKQLLRQYSNYRFINAFIYKLDELGNHYRGNFFGESDLVGKSDLEVVSDDIRERGGASNGKAVTDPKTSHTNEF